MMQKRLQHFFAYLTLVTFGLCDSSDPNSKSCLASLEATYKDTVHVQCSVRFPPEFDQKITAGIDALLPSKDPVNILIRTPPLDDPQAMSKSATLDERWETFSFHGPSLSPEPESAASTLAATTSSPQLQQPSPPNISVSPVHSSGWDSLQFGFDINHVTCNDELELRCWCDVGQGGERVSSNTRQITVGVEPNVEITTTTPVQSLWQNGIDEGTFVAARCEAVDSIESHGYIQWAIYTRRKFGEEEDLHDRIFLAKNEEIPRLQDPLYLGDYMRGPCRRRKLVSHLSLEVSRLDHRIQLECNLVNLTLLPEPSGGKQNPSQMRDITDHISVFSPVLEEFTRITAVSATLLKCESIAFPAPSYIWSDGNRMLNKSVYGKNSFLSLTQLSPEAVDRRRFFCSASNVIGGKRHIAYQNFSFVDLHEGAATSKMSKEEWGVHSNIASTSLNLLFSVGSLLGLAMLIFLLVRDHVIAQKKALAWGNIALQQRNLELDTCSPI